MSIKFFLDTNILVYSFDEKEKAKQKIAINLIGQALETGLGIISFQVIEEFLNVATRKFVKPLTTPDAQTYLQKILIPLCQVYPDSELYQETLFIAKSNGYSFYDSLILASAIRGNCTKIYTEELHDGQKIASLSIVNPFKKSKSQLLIH